MCQLSNTPKPPPPPHEKPGVHARIHGWFDDTAELRATGAAWILEEGRTVSGVKRERAERGTWLERPAGPTTAGLAASDLEAPKSSLLKNGANNTFYPLCVERKR